MQKGRVKEPRTKKQTKNRKEKTRSNEKKKRPQQISLYTILY
jgi:hypothetical protein